ncbi:MAG: hypothetical protein ACK4TO_00155 [Candidatus Nitrosotenuis sp.]
MILKLAIISAIIIAGGTILYPQLINLPSEHPKIEAVADDIGDLKDTTVKRVSHELDSTIDKVENKIDQITPSPVKLNPIDKIQEKIAGPPAQEIFYGQVYEKDESTKTCKISVPKMAKTINGVKELTHTITVPNCEYEKHKPVQVTQTTDPATNQQTISVEPVQQTQIFETLKLVTTKNQDNTVSISYEDTSGKTLKVTVTLRNSEKQLFSGEFFASKFDTSVNDVSSSPHIVEMAVEHAEYGTVMSSVFNPQGNNDTTIYGVFTK